MEQRSALQQARDIEASVLRILATIDIDDLPMDQRNHLTAIKHAATDTRLDVRDYNLADTAAEQKQLARAAIKRLQKLEADIVAASQRSVFTAIEVAQLSAQIQQLITTLA